MITKTRETFLPYHPPCIGEEEIEEVVDSLRSGWITTGPKTKRFEQAFTDFIGCESSLALSSCTAGLHLALVALGIGQGDEVITTTLTFCATANVVEHVGAIPVLVDVEPDTLNIDPVKVEAAITPRTRAIIPVHYAGHPVDLDAIMDIAKRHGLAVIEDAAHPLPAKYKGKMIGSHGNLTAFSFYATKNLTTAEGGMLVGPPELIDKARVIGLHGMDKDAWKRFDKAGSWKYDVVAPGFKYNMTDIQAAIGLVQLTKLEPFQARRRHLVNRYLNSLGRLKFFEMPVERDDVETAWHLFVLRLNLETLGIDRDQFIEELKDRNIGTSVHYKPLHLHSYYLNKYGFTPNDFPIASTNYERMISLPLNLTMSDDDQDDVISAILEIAEKYAK